MLTNIFKINKKGIGLIEVIAALGVSTVVITALVSLTISIVRSSLRSKLLLEGSKYANSQMELVRAYRDSVSWSVFKTAVEGCNVESNPCHMTSALQLNTGGVYKYNENTLEEVQVSFGVEIDASNDSVAKVTVKSLWYDGPKESATSIKNTYLYTNLTNWQQK